MGNVLYCLPEFNDPLRYNISSSFVLETDSKSHTVVAILTTVMVIRQSFTSKSSGNMRSLRSIFVTISQSLPYGQNDLFNTKALASTIVGGKLKNNQK